MSSIIFGMVLPWLLVAVGGWLLWQLMRQNGRIMFRLEAIELRLGMLTAGARQVPGLSPGTPAPDFDLPDIAGSRQTLTQYRGRRVLLVFFNPACGFCQETAPRLAALPTDGADGHPVPLILAVGGAEEKDVRTLESMTRVAAGAGRQIPMRDPHVSLHGPYTGAEGLGDFRQP